ncbi:putative HTH-type transcriptional regulator YdcR [Vibrio aerogenes CECT 7868]|uniref:Putative HTH-type transcriptional regulator YdcR n=2 Tax=Vibrio aerogenes TaxID=92172 RepID=A0A1M6A6M5_9VIBR|nr:PLP-dependent aminotransferase family protein [Vibrio aerogenes]SHI32120.1 putative HTH-type transcriptional regulator YdcR [Vibrio aerogenes CECT 7868]
MNTINAMNTMKEISAEKFEQACSQYPKYQALAWVIEQAIHEGKFVHDQKLPAQRILADALNITHGTVTRAYALLEKKGIVDARLGDGTYVRQLHQTSNNTEKDLQNREYDFASSMQPMLGQQLYLAHMLKELSDDPGAVESVMTHAYQGLDRHKKAFLSWLASKGIEAGMPDICFTNGAQQGIFTCVQILTRNNDYILHEALTYPGLLHAAEASHVNTLGVPFSDDGLDLEILEKYCQQYHPKLLYITPNMQNPTNIRYTTQQLDRIIALSRQYDFYIVEDDVNYCLPEDWQRPIQQRAQDRVFYLSSLSKYVAGGLRIAYSLIPAQWQAAFNAHIHSQCWMLPTLNFELAARFLNSHEFNQNQAYLADEMRYRQNLFKDMAHRHGLTTRGGRPEYLAHAAGVSQSQPVQALIGDQPH